MARIVDRVIREASRAIAGIGAGNPRFEAELLLSHALRRPRMFLFTHPEYRLCEEEEARFAELLGRRLSGEPLQYVLGTAEFRELTLKVEPGVLIPRSETELLVEILWQGLGSRREGLTRGTAGVGGGSTDTRPWVIDVGVGSGAILLGLLYEASQSLSPDALWFRALGIDVAPAALRLTAENARLNRLPVPHLVRGDLLASVDAERPVTAIVSNPPYITSDEMVELAPEIRDHEPPVALDGGPDGLDVIRELLDQALGFIVHGALLCFEIGALQAEPMRRELAQRGLLSIGRIFPDLADRPRVVLIDPQR
jgi:release factor glutamine methyltransferase